MQLKRRRAENELDKFIRDVFYNDNDVDQTDLFVDFERGDDE